MTLDEYNEIMKDAIERYTEYKNMVGNFSQMINRKEDYPEYWIAVVASEYGRKHPE